MILVTGMDTWRLGAQVIQAQLGEAGVLANIRLIAAGAREPIMQEGSYDVEIMNAGDWGADPALVGLQFSSGTSQAIHTRWSNERIDEIFELGVATSDQAERQKLYWEAAEIFNEEQAPYVYLFSPHNAVAFNKGLAGFRPASSYNFITWDMVKWHWAE